MNLSHFAPIFTLYRCQNVFIFMRNWIMMVCGTITHDKWAKFACLYTWTAGGKVSRATVNRHFFLICQHLPIKFIPSTPQSNLLCPPPYQIMNPIRLPIELLHLIFNQSESDKPILSNLAVSDHWSVDVALKMLKNGQVTANFFGDGPSEHW